MKKKKITQVFERANLTNKLYSILIKIIHNINLKITC